MFSFRYLINFFVWFKNVKPGVHSGAIQVSIGIHWYPLVSIGIHWYPLVSIGIHSGPFRSIQVHSGPFRSIQVHSGPFRSIQVHSDPFRSIQVSIQTGVRDASRRQVKYVQNNNIYAITWGVARRDENGYHLCQKWTMSAVTTNMHSARAPPLGSAPPGRAGGRAAGQNGSSSAGRAAGQSAGQNGSIFLDSDHEKYEKTKLTMISIRFPPCNGSQRAVG